MAKKKVLLMGKAHSGKTSMRSIIFANYLARDTTRLSPTLDVEHHHVRFLGDLVLNLWDCGGQDAFYENYFERDRETIFRSVELLIYVFDIESDTPEKDFDHFCFVLEAIEENSPDSRIFILVHKMDLVAEEDKLTIYEDRKRLISDSCISCGVEHYQIYGTSIWDETLYKAWSDIVTNLIPNINLLENQLQNFCRICDADEVVLFERATFLVISHAQSNDITDDDDEDEDTKEMHRIMLNINNRNGTNTTTNQVVTTNDDIVVPSVSQDINDNDNVDNNNEDGRNDIDNHTVERNGNNTNKSNGSGGDVNSNNSIIPYQRKQQSVFLKNSTTTTSTNTTVGSYKKRSTILLSPTMKHVKRISHYDAHRFEKISNIVKQFKLSCGKAQSTFQGMEVQNSRFNAYIDAFTANTYIMVIVSNPYVHTAATILNIQNARDHFEKFIPRI